MKSLSIVIPAFNEKFILKNSILKIISFCEKKLDLDWQVVIVDNKSTDQTAEIGKNLAKDYNKVKYLHIDQAGKGIAIKSGWEAFSADFYLFMDADLATDLSAINLAIAELEKGFDAVIGSRTHQNSIVKRSFTRRIFSKGYYLALKIILKTKITDAPCGFKAINDKVKHEVLPLVKNNAWFFDSELALLCEHKKYKISEIPVTWQEPRTKKNKSKVKVLSLSANYLRQILKLKKRFQNE